MVAVSFLIHLRSKFEVNILILLNHLLKLSTFNFS